MSEEPLFDASLKKRKKKKTVAFSEDPLGADADPTTPAPETIDDVTADGVSVDMGSKTVHEQLARNEKEEAKNGVEEDDTKAMFGDLKKKKKKTIPMDLVSDLCHFICFYLLIYCSLKKLQGRRHLSPMQPMTLTSPTSRKRRKRKKISLLILCALQLAQLKFFLLIFYIA
jgi:hypothetical protein